MWYARNAHLITIPIVHLEIANAVLFTEGKGEHEQTGMRLRLNKARKISALVRYTRRTLCTVVRCDVLSVRSRLIISQDHEG